MLLSATYSATLYAIRCLTDPTIPSNDGCKTAIKINAPKAIPGERQMPAATFRDGRLS
jgi:N-methylhydantoinase B